MLNDEILVCGIPVQVHKGVDSAVESIFSTGEKRVIPGFAIAINPEKLMKARYDKNLRDVLLSATLRFADGIGVVLVLRSKGAEEAERIPGCEFWVGLMQKAGQLHQPVYLVGARSDVLSQVRGKLAGLFGVNVVGMHDGFFSAAQQNELIQRIKMSGARIVTVAMGSPRQEFFIRQCRQAYPDAFYMGVGGTYDVFSGSVRRAPSWARRLNIEWLYRLLANPSRAVRQLVLLKYLWLFLVRRL